MKSCSLLLLFCFIVAYSADNQPVSASSTLTLDTRKLYDLPVVSSDGYILMIPRHLILYSSVLTCTRKFRSNRHTHFGFCLSMLCLLLKLLNFESLFARTLTDNHNNFLHQSCYQDYTRYNYTLRQATKRFKGLCFTPYTQARAFELACFFDMPSTILCVANIGATADLHYDAIKDLAANSANDCPYPYIPLYLKAVRTRLAERDCAARYNYIKHAFIDPFFKGLTILDLLKTGFIAALHAQQSKFYLPLADKGLYSLRGAEGIDYCDICKKLSLAHNYFTYISPRDIGLFTHLQSLDLTNNQLSQVDFVGALPQLRFLTLAHNKIKKICNNLQKLELLEELDVSRNYLTSISIKPGVLNKLAHLNLHTNYIASFKRGAGSMQNIRFLDLGINQMSSFPGAHFSTIKELFLDANHVASLADITHIPNIAKLNLADNQIMSLDPAIAQLTHLHALDLSDNMLIDITLIAQLKQLAILILKRNKVDAYHAKQFFKLMIPNNTMRHQPLLTHLMQLDLSGNSVSAKKITVLRKMVNKHRPPDQQLYVGNLQQLVSK